MTYFVTAIGAPFQKHDDILGHREHKDTEKNTLQAARSTRRRAAAGEACQQQTNDHWTVAQSFVCGLRASRLGLQCRPTASSAFSVSQCLSGLSKPIRQRNYELLYLGGQEVVYGMQRTMEGPTHVARPSGSFFHAAIARLNFGLLGLVLGNGRPDGR